MNKVLLIIQREYLSRVKKKSFLLLTFLVPSLFIGMYVAIFFIYKHNDDNAKSFHVIDESGIFQNQFKDQKNLSFDYPQHSYGEAKKTATLHQDVTSGGGSWPPEEKGWQRSKRNKLSWQPRTGPSRSMQSSA